MEAALHFHCQWTTVERSIRTAVERAYKINPILLCKIAGYPLTCIPTASEFIEIIALTYCIPLNRRLLRGTLSYPDHFSSFFHLFRTNLLTFYSWSCPSPIFAYTLMGFYYYS